MIRFLKFSFTFAVLTLSFFRHDAAAQEKVRIAYSAISGAMLTPWVGAEAGIFKKHGLDAQLIYIAGGPTAAAALVGGDVEVSLASGDGLIRTRLQGVELVSVADMTSTLVFSLMSRPEISSARELKGKRLGASRFGSSSHAALLAGLKHFNIDPTEVTILQMGGIPQILAGMEAGAISGGVLSPPINIKGKKLGMRELLEIGTLKIPFQTNTFIAKRDFIQKNPETIRRLMRSIVESIHRIKTDQAFTQKALAKYTKIEDPDILAETYRIFAQNYLARVPYPSEEAVKLRLAEFGAKDEKARAANPRDFVDPRWLKELEESGFIARLYKQ
ncbi:MAG: ABC transporter substrate-binding protein [Deltaproteobacteria bacterium]|nr:ABC transporter substrate-binding protein [Deltaproteobacteria bacterium]